MNQSEYVTELMSHSTKTRLDVWLVRPIPVGRTSHRCSSMQQPLSQFPLGERASCLKSDTFRPIRQVISEFSRRACEILAPGASISHKDQQLRRLRPRQDGRPATREQGSQSSSDWPVSSRTSLRIGFRRPRPPASETSVPAGSDGARSRHYRAAKDSTASSQGRRLGPGSRQAFQAKSLAPAAVAIYNAP